MIYSFLMIGQSNMAGRGELGSVPEIRNKNILMLRNGRWQQMVEPINQDRPFSGVGLAASFADNYVKATGNQIGLIPCADGGTSLDEWSEGSQLYQNAIYQTRLAQKISNVSGILWHQGESDSQRAEDAYTYAKRFSIMIHALQRDTNLIDVPVVIGEIGHFVGANPDKIDEYPFWSMINAALHSISDNNPFFSIASSEGLNHQGDYLHFDGVSYRELGRRYYQAYKERSYSGE